MRDKMRLLTPGPTPLPEEVRLTLALDMVHHRKPGFTAVLGEVQEGLRELFGHAGPVLVLTASGTGAMWAAVTNLFRPKERVLVIEGGKFGERWVKMAGSHGLDCTILGVPWGKAATAELVAKALDANPGIVGVFVQASETSTGVMHPVRQIAEVTRARNVLLVADGISAVGISPCPMDEWGVDCLLTGSQKGLMLPPGLSFLALSPRAWERVEQVAPRNFYFDLLGERKKTLGSQTLFTPGINLIQGLHTCLQLFREAGLPAVYRKQWALTCMCRAGIAAMGLAPLAERDYTWGLTSVKMPAGVDGGAVLKAAAERYGVVMAGGQDALKGRIVRVGHMGYVDWADLSAGLHALARSMQLAGGYTACRDYLEQALAAYEQALADGPPAL